MEIANINGCSIHLVAKDHTLIICEPDAVFIRCTVCGEVKSVHMLTDDNRSLPWMRQCYCNAPHSGGDTQPLPEEPEPALPLDHTLMPTAFHARLVERSQ